MLKGALVKQGRGIHLGIVIRGQQGDDSCVLDASEPCARESRCFLPCQATAPHASGSSAPRILRGVFGFWDIIRFCEGVDSGSL